MLSRVVSALCPKSCSGHGSCWATEDGFTCRCRFGYTGKACELVKEAATTASSASSESSIVPLILFAGATLLVVGLALWIWSHWGSSKVADIAGKSKSAGEDVVAVEGSIVTPSAPAAELVLDA